MIKITKIILRGRPITKKNSQMPIKTKTGKFFIIQSKQYRLYEKDCLLQLKEQFLTKPPIKGRLHLKVFYYMPDKRKPDLLNLEQATADILEKARVIDNDRDVESWDGSRIMGKDKENPRVEIFIEEI